jgi:hypothetical protein
MHRSVDRIGIYLYKPYLHNFLTHAAAAVAAGIRAYLPSWRGSPLPGSFTAFEADCAPHVRPGVGSKHFDHFAIAAVNIRAGEATVRASQPQLSKERYRLTEPGALGFCVC